MKATMTLDQQLGWEITLLPETDVEQTMMEAAHKGYGVKCEVYGDDEPGTIKIRGEGKRHVRPIPSGGDDGG